MKRWLLAVSACMVVGFFHYRNSAQEVALQNLTIRTAVEQDILNVKTQQGSPTDSIVLQMANSLLETKKLKYKNFVDRYDGYSGSTGLDLIQTLESNAGRYNNEYTTARNAPNLDYDNNWIEHLRALGNNEVAPRYQEVLEAR